MPTSATSTQPMPAAAQLMQMTMGKWVATAISAAAEFGIADLLAKGDKTAEELASATSTHAPSLYRLLRTLASVGVFAETQPRTFTLTPLAQCLRSDSPDSLHAWARFMTMPLSWNAWGQLGHSVKTGQTYPQSAFGVPNPFEYFKTRPEEAAIFDAAMTDLSRLNAPGVAQAYDFGRFRQLVDVAGGQGFLLATILKKFPKLQGVLFDLEAVVNRAGPLLVEHGVSGRCEVVAGNFFHTVPAGADGYLMQHIIHDWDDERAVAILRNIRKSIEPLGRLVLVEAVISPGNSPSPGKFLDLEMLLLPGGLERTEAEYRDLFAAADFRLLQVHATGGAEQVIEAAPY
jgi:hypothetical protein